MKQAQKHLSAPSSMEACPETRPVGTKYAWAAMNALKAEQNKAAQYKRDEYWNMLTILMTPKHYKICTMYISKVWTYFLHSC